MARIGNDGGFQRALARFKSHLSPVEQESFGVTSLEDVQKTIIQIQSTQGSQSQMRNLTRIKAFIEAMEQYGKVVEVFLNASSILAFVWGPIKFLLQIASTWAESFDVLLDAYEEIGENIPQLLEYGEIFNRHAHMRKVLELMYGDILEFHRRALKFFSRPTWKKLFHSSWKTFRTQFQYILSSLSRHKSLIENQASLLDYEQSKYARVAAKNSFEEIAEAEKKRRSLAVTDKIRPPNSRIDQDKAQETRHEYPESGKWILRHAFLRDWMDLNRPNLPLLWVNGIPGAGKTVIASLIIEETEAINSVVVGFFYCRHSDNQKNSFNKILRGILAQMARQNEELLSYVYDACCTSDETTIDSESLLKRLVEVSLRTCANTCIIIDGIDECDEAEERKTMAWFLEMSKVINRDNAGSMRLLFISQRDKVAEKLLNRASVITLDSKCHQEDIQGYASHWSSRIRQKFEISEASASRISINVAAKAQGLFLFAKLVLTYLYNQTTREKLFRELQPDSFPTGLEAAYERIASRIFENPKLSEREDAHNIFRWIVCARKPLKWSEIQSIFAIDPFCSRVDFEERQLRVTWRDLCGSLVESGAEDTLELVHNSAKQYLIQSGRIAVRLEELHIAEFCLNYLNFRCFDANLTDPDIRNFLREGYYSFEDYAIAHWLDHLDSSTSHSFPMDSSSCERLGHIIDSFLFRHGSDSPPDLTTVDSPKFQSIREWSFAQTLNALAQLASEKTCNTSYLDVETQLQRRRLIYEDIISSTNPLTEVFRRFLLLNGSGCYKCPKIWCGYFADGFQRREDRDKHVGQHERPFRCSFEECLHAELGFESEKGLKRHEKTSHSTGQTHEWAFPTMKPRKPLDIFTASAKGDLETVKRLVGEGVDINKTSKPKGSITAISLAIKHCRPQIVSYLIYQGNKTPGSTVLDSFIESSPANIVQMVLEMQVNSYTKKKLAQDALIPAVRWGREEVVHLLLTYDVDINTVWDSAIESSPANIVQMLLEMEVDSDTKKWRAQDALIPAVRCGREEVVHLLLTYDVDINTVLDSAIESSPANIVQMLLEMQVDSDTKKKLAQDALIPAARCGREKVVHLLLTYDVDINKRSERTSSDFNFTALEMARMKSYDNIVRILVDNGARDEREEAEKPPTSPFDFEKFLETDGEFSFDPSVTFENPFGTLPPILSLPAAQAHAQAQAQAKAQQQTAQQEKQQQRAAFHQQQLQTQLQLQTQAALQQASQATTTQGQPAPQPQMTVQTHVQSPNEALQAAAAMRLQHQQIKMPQQELREQWQRRQQR